MRIMSPPTMSRRKDTSYSRNPTKTHSHPYLQNTSHFSRNTIKNHSYLSRSLFSTPLGPSGLLSTATAGGSSGGRARSGAERGGGDGNVGVQARTDDRLDELNVSSVDVARMLSLLMLLLLMLVVVVTAVSAGKVVACSLGFGVKQRGRRDRGWLECHGAAQCGPLLRSAGVMQKGDEGEGNWRRGRGGEG